MAKLPAMAHPGGRPRTPLQPEQLSHLAAIAAGNITRRHLCQRGRWSRHVGYGEAYQRTLSELEQQWQDQLLEHGSELDQARYAAMLADGTPIVRRLRHIRRALLSAENQARQQRQRKPPTWEKVRQQVYAESAGLLTL